MAITIVYNNDNGDDDDDDVNEEKFVYVYDNVAVSNSDIKPRDVGSIFPLESPFQI